MIGIEAASVLPVVWVILSEYDHEGQALEGVAFTLEDADAMVAEPREDDDDGDYIRRGWVRFELGHPVEASGAVQMPISRRLTSPEAR